MTEQARKEIKKRKELNRQQRNENREREIKLFGRGTRNKKLK